MNYFEHRDRAGDPPSICPVAGLRANHALGPSENGFFRTVKGRVALNCSDRDRMARTFEELEQADLFPLVDALPELMKPASAALGVPA
jgi:hypothetical protein